MGEESKNAIVPQAGLAELETQERITATQLEITKIQAGMQVETAKINAESQAGWREFLKDAAGKLEGFQREKVKSEIRYTITLTMCIIGSLLLIVIGLFVLTWNGKIGAEPLLFFLGTLTGSVLILLTERVKRQ